MTHFQRLENNVNDLYDFLKGDHALTYIRLAKFVNIGKSFFLIKGVNRSKFKNIITIDCDLPYLNSLKKVIEGLKRIMIQLLLIEKLKEVKWLDSI